MIFKTPPYKYQEINIYKALSLLKENGFAFFDMDVGTGKTKTSLNTCELLLPELNCIMIICPKALINTWQEEISKHTFITWPIYEWKKSNFDKYMKFNKPSICIINIEAFSRTNDQLKKLMEKKCGKQTIILLDESSKIKTSSSLRTKNLLKLSRESGFRACLTGTKITNSMLDIFSQFEFLKHDFFKIPWGKTLTQRFYMFRNQFAVLEEQYAKGRTFKKVVGYKCINRLMGKINPYMVTARKEDCLKDLPEKIYQKIHIEMNTDQEKVYNDLKEKMMTEYNGQELTVEHKMTLFMRFRQITGGFMPESGMAIGKENPKIEMILAESDSIEKAIIWSCYVAEIKAITLMLGDCALPYYGEIKQKDRDENIRRFKEDAEIKYLICNPASAAFGLNLQFSNVSYYFNRPLSVEQNLQSEGRQHRSGQKNSVIYKDLVCQGTIDERIIKLLGNRQDLITQINGMKIKDFYELI